MQNRLAFLKKEVAQRTNDQPNYSLPTTSSFLKRFNNNHNGSASTTKNEEILANDKNPENRTMSSVDALLNASARIPKPANLKPSSTSTTTLRAPALTTTTKTIAKTNNINNTKLQEQPLIGRRQREEADNNNTNDFGVSKQKMILDNKRLNAVSSTKLGMASKHEIMNQTRRRQQQNMVLMTNNQKNINNETNVENYHDDDDDENDCRQQRQNVMNNATGVAVAGDDTQQRTYKLLN